MPSWGKSKFSGPYVNFMYYINSMELNVPETCPKAASQLKCYFTGNRLKTRCLESVTIKYGKHSVINIL